jgi:hypothetical protein
MCRVGAKNEIDCLYAACLLLADALEDALCARPLDPHRNSRIRRLEHPGELFRESKVERRIESDLAFFPRRFDQGGVDRG